MEVRCSARSGSFHLYADENYLPISKFFSKSLRRRAFSVIDANFPYFKLLTQNRKKHSNAVSLQVCTCPKPVLLSSESSSESESDFYSIQVTGHVRINNDGKICTIKVDVWRQPPPPTKHPPKSTSIKTITAVNGLNIPVLGRVEMPFEIQSKIHPFRTSCMMPY